MTEESTIATLARLVMQDVRNGDRLENAKSENKKYVADCPFRKIPLPQICDKIPDNFLCGSFACWELGTELLELNPEDMTEKNCREWVRNMNPEKKFWLDLAIEEYCKT
jgi:hypothetical protein